MICKALFHFTQKIKKTRKYIVILEKRYIFAKDYLLLPKDFNINY